VCGRGGRLVAIGLDNNVHARVHNLIRHVMWAKCGIWLHGTSTRYYYKDCIPTMCIQGKVFSRVSEQTGKDQEEAVCEVDTARPPTSKRATPISTVPPIFSARSMSAESSADTCLPTPEFCEGMAMMTASWTCLGMRGSSSNGVAVPDFADGAGRRRIRSKRREAVIGGEELETTAESSDDNDAGCPRGPTERGFTDDQHAGRTAVA
jgi:hypothetical protein